MLTCTQYLTTSKDYKVTKNAIGLFCLTDNRTGELVTRYAQQDDAIKVADRLDRANIFNRATLKAMSKVGA